MNRGHPEYGCFIGQDKTLTNLDYDAQIMNVVEPGAKSEFVSFSPLILYPCADGGDAIGFPWCGFLINMRDLSVTVDYSRYATWGSSAFPYLPELCLNSSPYRDPQHTDNRPG